MGKDGNGISSLRTLLLSAFSLSEVEMLHDEENLLDSSVALAASLAQAEAGFLLTLDDEGKRLTYRGEMKKPGREVRGVTFGPREGGIYHSVLTSHQPLMVSGLGGGRNPEYKAIEKQLATIEKSLGFKVRDLLMVPVVHQEGIIGILEVINRRGTPGGFDIRDQATLSLVSKQAGLILGKFSRLKNLHGYLEKAIAKKMSTGGKGQNPVNILCEIIHDKDITNFLQLTRRILEIIDRSQDNLPLLRQLLETISKISSASKGSNSR